MVKLTLGPFILKPWFEANDSEMNLHSQQIEEKEKREVRIDDKV